MTWLLDTSVCIPLINRTDERTAERLLSLSPGAVRLCSVVKAELQFGAHNSSRVAENLQRVEIFCRAFESLPFDDAAAERYGVIRAQLRREGRPIGAKRPDDCLHRVVRGAHAGDAQYGGVRAGSRSRRRALVSPAAARPQSDSRSTTGCP